MTDNNNNNGQDCRRLARSEVPELEAVWTNATVYSPGLVLERDATECMDRQIYMITEVCEQFAYFVNIFHPVMVSHVFSCMREFNGRIQELWSSNPNFAVSIVQYCDVVRTLAYHLKERVFLNNQSCWSFRTFGDEKEDTEDGHCYYFDLKTIISKHLPNKFTEAIVHFTWHPTSNVPYSNFAYVWRGQIYHKGASKGNLDADDNASLRKLPNFKKLIKDGCTSITIISYLMPEETVPIYFTNYTKHVDRHYPTMDSLEE